MSSDSISWPAPRIVPVLDPAFRPAVLENRQFRKRASQSPAPAHVELALEQADGSTFRYTTPVFSDSSGTDVANFHYLERLLKFLLWSRGGYRIHYCGPAALGAALQRHFKETATGQFDAEIMGGRIYEKPFEVVVVDKVPSERFNTATLGRNWDGCRIGFDLGASDRKVAAVIDGKCVFSDETEWDPVRQSDPQWHFAQIMESLKSAAAHLPRVDAIGGSSAGVIVNNRIKVASLFRGVPPDLFQTRVKNLFLELKAAWGDIPFEVVNDGEVTALAGSMARDQNGVLGLALGSSQAAGYVTPQGTITAWLNELAFAPVDYNPSAPVDEWSGDAGCGVQYFSQQCVGRLLPATEIEADSGLSLPEKLKVVQSLMAKGDPQAAEIYRTIGVYLGYTLAHYSEFYEISNALILGRVTSGPGGTVIVKQAEEVLRLEFPDLAERLHLHVPGEKEKRHGQAMAAASLPRIEP